MTTLRGDALSLSETWTLHGALAALLTSDPALRRAPALLTDAGPVSFGELTERAARIAQALRARLREAPSLEGGPLIGVCMSRSPDLVAVLLAILQVGGAYLPLDPHYPHDRLAHVASDAAPALLVTGPEHAALARALLPDRPCWVLDPSPSPAAPDGAAADADLPSVTLSGESRLFAVLYTSGSSGRPRGVCLSHRAAQNRLAWMWRSHPFAPGEVCCFKTPLGFVDSVWELFGALLHGVPVAVAPDALERDPKGLLAFAVRHGVSRLIVVPSLLRLLLPLLPSQRSDADAFLKTPGPTPHLWTCSGESLPADLARAFLDRRPRDVLLNLYGSTEVMGDVTAHRVREGTPPVPVGRPIANTVIDLLDEVGEPVKAGEIGAIHVSGEALACGYLVHGQATAAPLGEGLHHDTGDLGRLVADPHDGAWTLVHEGRRDRRVKLLGNRFDLAELERVLQAVEGVATAVASFREDAAGPELLGFVCPSAPGVVTLETLREACGRALPPYAQPTLHLLDDLPLLPNGKLDRQRLRATSPPPPPHARPAVPPGDTSAFVQAWSDILGDLPVHEDLDFFQAGGSSIQAVALIRRLREAGMNLALDHLYAAPTPRALKHLIEAGLAPAASTRLTLAPMTARDRSVALTFLTDTFARSDRLGLALGATRDSFEALMGAFLDAALPQGLSFLASAASTAPAASIAPSGCVLAVDLWRHHQALDAGRIVMPSVFTPLFAMFDALEASWFQREPVPSPGEWVYVLVLGASPSDVTSRVVHGLEATVVAEARRRGYQGLLTINTHAVTQHVCEALGYRTAARMNVRHFVHEGASPFAHVPPGSEEIVLHERRLG
ncbi:non-ribosomal peptide synthetase [Chondromyces apiculatus]|uniref:Long-chain-fatty-acid--CoA ligase n=1 Tax=Chondromyces apiculatus DSM 436 TaxID=1192034 RepID=A0A017T3K1_9BACT|nr:non-ribosomal peptide synthetase [Chondromyces apiculatus]EYF03420.1 Long-chain-fatty-acid--CoA ligase [Chondromyces apiculatus DSM 436]